MPTEELAELAAGGLSEERGRELAAHTAECRSCSEWVAVLERVDAALGGLARVPPPAAVVLAARRAFGAITRPETCPEIMSLEEVGEFLRLGPEELAEIVESLPAFELGGQVRLRRRKLLDWIRQQEQQYAHRGMAKWSARARYGQVEEGVA